MANTDGETSDKREDNGGPVPASELECDGKDHLVASESLTPLKTPLNDVEVKFITNDSINGDAKIDIENVKIAFAGMAKEELMKYANDPFWIRLRWFLFIFFWLLWLGMFAGAVAIIIMAPRCQAPEPRKWFQQSPLYEVEIKSFVGKENEGTLLQKLAEKLQYFSDLKIEGLILPQILKSVGNNPENVIDFKSLDDDIGSEQDLKDLTAKAKAKGIRIIMTLVPNHSSKEHPWFKKSAAREAPYTNYYIWASKPNNGGVPNNWLSVTGGTAWTWNEERKEYYLHQFNSDQPDLNFNNVDFLDNFKEVLDHWLSFGISGFRMLKTQHLFEDPAFEDEVIGNKPGTYQNDYDYYLHSKTFNRPQVANILSTWRKIIHEYVKDDGILISERPVPVPENFNSSRDVVDLSYSTRYLSPLKADFTADQLHERIFKLTSLKSWNGIYMSSNEERVGRKFGVDAVDAIDIVSLMLPGTPIIYYGEELGLHGAVNETFPWDDSSNEFSLYSQKKSPQSHFKVYEQLLKARSNPSFLYGDTIHQVINHTVFSYTRVKSGNPGYLIAYNPSSENITVSFTSAYEQLPEELTVLIRSTNYGLDAIPGKTKLQSNSVPLTPKSALVLTFVPKSEG